MESYGQARQIIEEIQGRLFPKFESNHDSIGARSIEQTIDERIKLLDSHIDKMEIALNKASSAQRSTIKFKLDQIRQVESYLKLFQLIISCRYDQKHIINSFRALNQRRQNREKELRDREELLTRRFTTNADFHSSGDTQIQMGNHDYYSGEKSKLNRFNIELDDMLAQGTAVLSSLRNQRTLFNSIHSRILETANSLGLSNSVMRLIEKREFADKFILFGGMFIVTVLMFLIWFYLT